MNSILQVRDATLADLGSMASMAAELVRFHHALDPLRYFLPEGVEPGYLRWFTRERENPDAMLLLAASGDEGLGYAYGRFEPRDMNLLLDAHAALHDIYVRPEARGQGVAERLLVAFLARVDARSVPRVVLHTAVQNDSAQRVFRKLGFRPTMLEMLRTPPR